MTNDSLTTLLPKFTQDLENKKRSPSTVLAYRADLEQLIKFLQNKNKVLINQVTTSDIESFRDSLFTQKYTPKTVSRKLNAIKTFFRWLIAEKIVSSDASKPVAHPKTEPSVPKFPSPLEYRALRDVVRDDIRIASMIELVLQTGLRISEIASLKLTNVSKNEVKIEPYATQPARTVPVNPPAKEALDTYLKVRPKTDSSFVFVSKNGKPLAVRNIRAAVDRYFQKAEIPNYSINDLRSTFIVENLKSGVDLVFLSQVAGHKRLSTTVRYLELAKVEEPGKKQVLAEL